MGPCLVFQNLRQRDKERKLAAGEGSRLWENNEDSGAADDVDYYGNVGYYACTVTRLSCETR